MSDDASAAPQGQLPARSGRIPAAPPAREVEARAGVIAANRILTAIRRHVPLMVVVTTFVTTFALIAFRQPAPYLAKAVLRVVGEPDSGAVVSVNSLVPRVRSRAVVGAVVDSLGLQLRPVPVFYLLRPPMLPEIELEDVRLQPHAEPDTLTLLFSPDHLIVRYGHDSKPAAYGEPILAGGGQFTIPKAPGMAGAVLAVLPRELAIDRLLTHLSVIPLTGTDALEVRYVDPDPRLAQAVTNELVRAFHASTINSSQEQARRRRIFLKKQLREAERHLSQAQAGVNGFRSRHRVARSSDKLARQQFQLVALDARRGDLEVDRRVFRSLLSRLETPGDSARTERLYTLAYAPEIGTDPIIGKVFQRLLTYGSRLDSLITGSDRGSATNPEVLRLRQMVRSSEGELVRAIRGRLASIEDRLAALGNLRTSNADEIAALPTLEAEEERLGQKVSALAEFAGQLRVEHQKARLSEALAAAEIEIVDSANLPYLATGTPWWIKVAFAFVFGIVVGTLLSLLLEMKNRSIRSPEELEEVLHLRGLGVIPPVTEAVATDEVLALTPGTGQANNDVVKPGLRGVVTDSPVWPSVGGEAFRLLYSSLTSGWGDRRRSILVTSVSPAEGKTLVAANLAVTFAREGARVLLIDCDLRRPRLHKMFQVTRAPGLVELLRPEAPPESGVKAGPKRLEGAYSMLPDLVRTDGHMPDGHVPDRHVPVESNGHAGTALDRNGRTPALASPVNHERSASFRNIRETSRRGLWLLPCGAVERSASGTLKAGTFRSLLNEISGGFDVIILDTPPVRASADAVILAPVADDVLLVVRAGYTDRDAADRAHQQLRNAGGNVVGAVLNDPDGKVARDRMLYYAYGYPVTTD